MMDRERLEQIKKAKNEMKEDLKDKDKKKLTRKELDELTVKMAEMLGLIK
jgi:hypothetical protein